MQYAPGWVKIRDGVYQSLNFGPELNGSA